VADVVGTTETRSAEGIYALARTPVAPLLLLLFKLLNYCIPELVCAGFLLFIGHSYQSLFVFFVVSGMSNFVR
jgi:hypothetical protein